jgi:hypothetical protein
VSRPRSPLALALAVVLGMVFSRSTPVRAARVVARTTVHRSVAVVPARPVAAAVATAVVVGSVVRSLPPKCAAVMVGNVSYQQCGATWYRPQYSGSAVSYVVVNPPR